MSIYIQLLLASFFWGSNVIVMKLLLDEIPFLLLATMRVFLSLIFLGIYLKWKKISFDYDYKKKALAIGILAIYLNFFFTFLGMNQVKGIDNAFMNALAPILTFVFSLLLLKQKGNMKEYIAIGMTVFAFLLSIRFKIFSIKIGFWYLFLGMVLYMLANVCIQKWKLHNSLILS
ncbi:MAG: DMT family transporter, partial [Coprobacillus cateniformis]